MRVLALAWRLLDRVYGGFGDLGLEGCGKINFFFLFVNFVLIVMEVLIVYRCLFLVNIFLDFW